MAQLMTHQSPAVPQQRADLPPVVNNLSRRMR
jgi:hypothetical protein